MRTLTLRKISPAPTNNYLPMKANTNIHVNISQLQHIYSYMYIYTLLFDYFSNFICIKWKYTCIQIFILFFCSLLNFCRQLHPPMKDFVTMLSITVSAGVPNLDPTWRDPTTKEGIYRILKASTYFICQVRSTCGFGTWNRYYANDIKIKNELSESWNL